MNLLPARKRRSRVFDMTPMIDVVFQLLIFFLFTSRFTETVRTPLDLPEERGDGAIDQPADVIVDVLADGRLVVDGTPGTMETFSTALETALLRMGDPSLLEVLVRADSEARAAEVNEVVALLARRDVRLWRLGTAVPAAGGGSP